MQPEYSLPFHKAKNPGFGIAPAPCDPKKLLEIPIGLSQGQSAKCPYCGKYHLVTGVNQNASIA